MSEINQGRENLDQNNDVSIRLNQTIYHFLSSISSKSNVTGSLLHVIVYTIHFILKDAFIDCWLLTDGISVAD